MNLIDIFNKQLTGDGGNKSYNNYIPTPKFRPSSLGTPCLRKLYYSYNRVSEDFEFPLNVKRICALGDSIHKMLSEKFRESGILIDYRDENGEFIEDVHNPGHIDYEFPIKNKELELSAKIDAVLKIDNKLWLGEYKSINDKGFSSLKEPKPEHLIQGGVYFYEFNRSLQEGIFKHIKELDGFNNLEGVRFLYVNKNNSEMKEFVVKDFEHVFTETITKMLTIKQYCDNNELPPKTKDWCNSCPWRIKCKGNSKGFR